MKADPSVAQRDKAPGIFEVLRSEQLLNFLVKSPTARTIYFAVHLGRMHVGKRVAYWKSVRRQERNALPLC